MKKDSKTQLTPLETALQKQFKSDAGIVRKAFALVEKDRATFAVNALKFGLCALATKSIVGHGKFGKWLAEALSEGGNTRPVAERTAKDYMGLAKVFIEKLSVVNRLSGHLAEGIDDVCGRYAIARSDFKINEFLADNEKTSALLDSTVRGMTLTQLRQLLREARSAPTRTSGRKRPILQNPPRAACAKAGWRNLRRCFCGRTGRTNLKASTGCLRRRRSSCSTRCTGCRWKASSSCGLNPCAK